MFHLYEIIPKQQPDNFRPKMAARWFHMRGANHARMHIATFA
jgi:hypothetical protein